MDEELQIEEELEQLKLRRLVRENAQSAGTMRENRRK